MTPERHALIKQRFLDACAVPAGERASYLDRACAGDPDLRQAVANLLLQHTEAATQVTAETRAAAPATAGAGSASARDELPPGAVVAERFRIVSRLGAGGMGVVYRADDLRLEQPVALKFLPPAYARDPTLRRLLEREVRAARLVTHPNVCRVHDLGETNGRTFITMEYVDGEDLKSLLRRIGRLPQERAIEITQQLCLALATIHRAGLVHRDLKPANVMLDAAGRVRITDFGIAGTHLEQAALGAEAGTPAYMAPEQLAGGQATVASDIYALGLTLYELFTGAPAFDATNLSELVEQKSRSRLKRPSQLVPDISPNVERALLRCLDADPAHRPASALAVGAAIAGGDMLTLAVAAGELPSPELVAAAGESDHTPRWLRHAALAACGLLLLAVVLLAPASHPVTLGGYHKSIEALAERARMVAWGEAAPGRMIDEAYGLAPVELVLPTPLPLERPGGSDTALFWYRAAPQPLAPRDGMNLAFDGGAVTPRDPPPVPDEKRVILNGEGAPVDLAALLAAETAGDGGDDFVVRVGRALDARSYVIGALIVASIPIAVLNLRRGRSDRRGAERLAIVALVLCLAAWALRVRLAPTIAAFEPALTLGLAGALLQCATLWLSYVALEPYVRRYWPQSLISWSRVLEGRFRDPLVGLHVLLGAVIGLVFAVLSCLDAQLPAWLGLPMRPYIRLSDVFEPLSGVSNAWAHVLAVLLKSIYMALIMLLLIVLARATLRSSAAAYLVAIPLLATTSIPLGVNPVTTAVLYGIGVALGAWLLIRFGPVAMSTAIFVRLLLTHFPVTADLRAWYAGYGIGVAAIAAGLVVTGYVIAGRRESLLANNK